MNSIMTQDAGRESLMARRVRSLPEYLFARTNALKAQARSRGIDVIDFGMGNPDRPPAGPIIEKLCEVAHDSKAHRYSASRGLPYLRREIAKRYAERYGVTLDPDEEVVVTIGSKEGLAHLAFALLDEGDSVLVPSPTYPIHTVAVHLAGARPVTIPLGDTSDLVGRLKHKIEAMTPKPKLLILSFPHNPTTAVVESDFFERVVSLARMTGIRIVHDLAYADLVYDGYRAPSFLQVPGAKDVGVESFSMTKSYSMAGWRVGFMLGNADIINTLARLKSYLDYGIFSPIQVAAIAALRAGDGPCREIAETYRARRDVLVDGMLRMGWEVDRPRATMYVWAKLPKAFVKAGSERFAETLLEEAAVAVSPGIGFGPEGEGYVRFALVENEERIRQALRSVRRIVSPGAKAG